MKSLLIYLILMLSAGGTALAQSEFTLNQPERLSYDIAFLWFDRFGEGSLTFEKADQPGYYRAVAHARTLGVAAWVSRDRQQTYESLMRLDEDGWLRPVQTRSITLKGKGSKQTRRLSQYDYDETVGKVFYHKYKKGRLYGKRELELPTDKRVFDLLSAFFNWRLGNFGELGPGTTFELPAFSKKGPTDLVIGVRTRQDQQQNQRFPNDGLLCRVLVDQEVFNTGGGGLFVWLNPEGEPGKMVIEQVLGLGDVWATIKSE